MPLLPFLKNKQRDASVVVQHNRTPDEGSENESDSHSAIHAAAQDILRAISDNDAAHLASALQAAYDICSSTETEGPGLEEDT